MQNTNSQQSLGFVQSTSTGTVYQLSKELGQGAFGKVFKATPYGSSRSVALKAIQITNPQLGLSAQQEALIGCNINHPNVVHGIEAFWITPHLWIVSEFCGGGTLEQRLKKRIPAELIRKWAEQLLQGINELHQKGILHRDIKPDNILLDDDDNIKIGDMGIATTVQHAKQGFTPELWTTFHSTFMGDHGTKMFMAPEVWQKRYMRRADIFAIGVVILAMVERYKSQGKYGVTHHHRFIGEYMASHHSDSFVSQLFKADQWDELSDVKGLVKEMLKYQDRKRAPELLNMLSNTNNSNTTTDLKGKKKKKKKDKEKEKEKVQQQPPQPHRPQHNNNTHNQQTGFNRSPTMPPPISTIAPPMVTPTHTPMPQAPPFRSPPMWGPVMGHQPLRQGTPQVFVQQQQPPQQWPPFGM